MISGLRLRAKSCSPPSIFFTAAVAMRVAGQRLLDATVSFLNSSAHPSAIRLILYLLRVYARWDLNHRISKFSGGERVRMCAFVDFFRRGRAYFVTINVPRTLISNIKSKRLGS